MKNLCRGLVAACLFIAIPATAATAVENRVSDAQIETLFPPHRATTTSGKEVDHSKYDSAKVCAGCHQDIYQEWRSSMMANAWDDPIYRALLRKASMATDGKVDNFCTGCHTPLGLLSGRIDSATNRQLPGDGHDDNLPGVDCEACHNITGINHLENGGYVLDAQLSDKPVKRGPRSDAVSPYHATEYSELHTRSEFCGSCHNVTHPFNQVPIERTYDEWYESNYRVQGIECQDCHMKPVPGKAAIMGPDRKDRASHHFAAANTTIMEYFGDTQNAERARGMLAQAAEVSLVKITESPMLGSDMHVTVKVENTGAGHKLPTGFPEGREVWLDFSVTDASGREVYRSGRIKNGKTEPGTHNFKVHMGDMAGNIIDVEVWRVERVISDNRLLPNGFAEVEYDFAVPEWATTPLNIDVRLKYWPFSQAMADYLLGENVLEVNIEEIASVEIDVAVAKNAKKRNDSVAMQ